MNNEELLERIIDTVYESSSSLESRLDDKTKTNIQSLKNSYFDPIFYSTDYIEKNLEKFLEKQKKDITNDSLKKEIISSKKDILEELKKNKLNQNQTSISLQKSDFDNYFKNLNDNINNNFSLMEGLIFGCVIMYIFFSRLFNNV